MKKMYVLYFCLINAFSSCFSQKSLPVKEIHVYKSVRMAGNIAVDERGKQISPSQFESYLIFAEAVTGVRWDTVWIKGAPYSVTAEETDISGGPIEVGMQKMNRMKIHLKPSKGYQILRLELNQSGNPVSASRSDTIIYVNYKYKGKHITKKVTEITQLQEPPSV